MKHVYDKIFWKTCFQYTEVFEDSDFAYVEFKCSATHQSIFIPIDDAETLPCKKKMFQCKKRTLSGAKEFAFVLDKFKLDDVAESDGYFIFLSDGAILTIVG